MSDQRDDLSVYRGLQGHWSNLQDENSYNRMKINESNSGNDEKFPDHQDYQRQNRYVHQDLYSSNMHYTAKTPDSFAGNPSQLSNNYNNSIFMNQTSNYDVDNIQQNFGHVDLNNGNHHNSNMNGNNQSQFMVPGSSYELFNQDLSHNVNLQQQCYPMMQNYVTPHRQHSQDNNTSFSLRQPHMREPPIPQHYAEIPDPKLVDPGNSQHTPSYNHQTTGKNQLIDNFLVNWNNNPSGTYSPFGHSSMFLNVQPNLLLQKETTNSIIDPNPNVIEQNLFFNTEPDKIKIADSSNRKETESFLFSDTSGKKRIVAEVKPMRPSYSAVLSQTPKGPNPLENSKKKNCNPKDQIKQNISKSGAMKSDKSRNHFAFGDKPFQIDDKNKKNSDRKSFFQSQVSSGSESGETNIDYPIKNHKTSTKNRGNGDSMNRKWVSLDDLSNDNDEHMEEKPGYTNCDSEFVFVSQPEEKSASRKRNIKKHDGNAKKHEKPDSINNEYNANFIERNNDADTCSMNQETFIDSDKLKRKNKEKSSNTSRKILSEKNKRNSQNRQKKSKGSDYMGKLQNYMDRWILILKNVIVWFFNLLSDIFRMSAQLSIDFFSVTCKNTYSWAADLWILIKEKIANTEWLCSIGVYVDSKVGHTWFAFWRKLKWMKMNSKFDDEKDTGKKDTTNIPLPATGDDAMKRLLACRGKDPYSILGVCATCSDEEIKRYYRRQAFLVHPDKNQQPGAEEAFKILQHAFDVIGEPERREMYDRKVLESAHMEAAWSEVSELLVQLQDKVRHAAATIRCTNCSRRHARTLATRPAYAARYCHQCKIHHAAKEGDIWAESSFWGLIWMYYACMDGAVYQITQWASCQKKNLKHLVANSHHVQYRIVLGSKSAPSNPPSGKQSFNSSAHDANIEDFLNNLYFNSAHPPPGTGRNMSGVGREGSEAAKNKKRSKKNKI